MTKKKTEKSGAKNGSGSSPRPRGGQTTYTQEVADEILLRLAGGDETLAEICRSADHLPEATTVRTWALDDREGFYVPYMRARHIGAHAMVDKILEAARNTEEDWQWDESKERYVPNHRHMDRVKVLIDTLKWYTAKVLPHLYGERVSVDHTGSVDHAHTHTHRVEKLTDEQLAAEIEKRGLPPAILIDGRRR